MNLDTRLLIIASVVALAAIAGILWRANTGKAKPVTGNQRVDLAELAATKNGELVTSLNTKITFLQFSSEFCTQCVQTARLLGELENSDADVTHLEVDITNRLDLARKYNILQTPTTLVLDRKGNIKSRIGGAPKAQTLNDEIGTFEI